MRRLAYSFVAKFARLRLDSTLPHHLPRILGEPKLLNLSTLALSAVRETAQINRFCDRVSKSAEESRFGFILSLMLSPIPALLTALDSPILGFAGNGRGHCRERAQLG